MSTSLLYHIFGVRDYRYVRTWCVGRKDLKRGQTIFQRPLNSSDPFLRSSFCALFALAYLAGGAAPFFTLKNAHQSTFGGGPCDGQIVKISPDQPVPVIVAAPTATPHPATVGQSVAFRVQATGSADVSLVYRWDFGDYNSTSVAHGGTATHTYTEPGT